MSRNTYPSLLARLLGRRRTTDHTPTLSWRGYTWMRIGAVWIPAKNTALSTLTARTGA